MKVIERFKKGRIIKSINSASGFFKTRYITRSIVEKPLKGVS